MVPALRRAGSTAVTEGTSSIRNSAAMTGDTARAAATAIA
jgi:hypothetical protein